MVCVGMDTQSMVLAVVVEQVGFGGREGGQQRGESSVVGRFLERLT